MSTKTTIKRIALVAVSALGLGVLSSVAPASAATATYTIGTPTVTPAATGSTFQITAPITFTGGSASDTATVSIVDITKAPGSTVTHSYPTHTNITTSGSYPGIAFTDASSGSNGVKVRATLQSQSATTTYTATGTVRFGVNVNVAGSYVFGIVDDLDSNGALSTGETIQYVTVTVADAPAVSVTMSDPLGVTYATYASYASTNVGYNGAWVKLQVVDAAGKPAVLNPSQLVNITTPSTMYLRNKAVNGGNAVAVGPFSGAAYGLVNTDFDANGVAWINLSAPAAGSFTETAQILGSSTTTSLALTFDTATKIAGAAANVTKDIAGATVSVTTPYVFNASNVKVTGTGTGTVSSKATSFGVNIVTTTAGPAAVKVANTTGTLFGGGALAADVIVDTTGVTAESTGTTTDGSASKIYGSLSIPVTLGLTSTQATYGTVTITPYASATVAATTVGDFVVSGAASTASSGGKLSLVAPAAATITVAPAATVSATVKCVDNFGAAKAAITLTPAVSGRNAGLVTLPQIVTDASGLATVSYVDASTSTTNLQDTLAFGSACTTSSTLLTVNYNATANFGVSTVKLTGGDTTAGVTNSVVSAKAIAAADGAQKGAQGITVTVADANAVGIGGVPYTATVSGTGAAITSTTASGYTAADGTATVNVYAWLNGQYTVTVTAGGKTGTGLITFASSGVANARIVSAKVTDNVVVGKVVDRFGNPVSGVVLYAKTTAPANIGGLLVATGSGTDKNGETAFVVSGIGSVTISAVNPSDPAGTVAGQTCALAGNYTCASGATAAKALTAYVAGTATTAEVGVGSTYSPAGVASVTVDVAGLASSSDAVDAANEATDAANAATDAANAAAEAADAATAAAQDAQAAVAALASQVADLIAGIKAQITALTNLVIKIQKKVKA